MDDSNRSIAKKQIARLLGNSANPTYVLSEQNRLVFANEAFGNFFECSVDSMVGIECSSPLMPDASAELQLASLLALPPGWSRRSIRLLPFECEQAKGIELVRCLIPLESTGDADVLCIICKSSDADRSGWTDDQLAAVQNVLQKTRARFENLNSLWFLQGSSPEVRRVLEQSQLANATSCNVLISGPTGSGQNWLANSLHVVEAKRLLLPESSKSLVRIECRLMDLDILRSMIELVEDSLQSGTPVRTLLLDSLESLPSDCMAMLADMLESHSKLRCLATLSVDDRVPITFGGPDWQRVISIVGTLSVELSRLTDRLNDIRVLVSAWLDSNECKPNKNIETTNAFIDALAAYPWPGDVEEFSATMRSAVASLRDSFQLDVCHLPVNVRTCVSHAEQSGAAESMIDLDAILEDVEKTLIMRALERFPTNKTAAAKLLSISRGRLLRRLQQWGMMSESENDSGDEDRPVFDEVQ